MDYLWTPWRYSFIKSAGKEGKGKVPGCVLCRALEAGDDAGTFILHRGDHNFVILNRDPYTNGHLMIAPLAHGGDLGKVPAATLGEMMMLCQKAQQAMKEIYQPDGFNIGMNLGRMAGAGVADHVHLHVLPRWGGDTAFVTTTAETRLLPEDLAQTYEKLKPFFA